MQTVPFRIRSCCLFSSFVLTTWILYLSLQITQILVSVYTVCINQATAHPSDRGARELLYWALPRGLFSIQPYLHHSKPAIGWNQFSNSIDIIKYFESRNLTLWIIIMERSAWEVRLERSGLSILLKAIVGALMAKAYIYQVLTQKSLHDFAMSTFLITIHLLCTDQANLCDFQRIAPSSDLKWSWCCLLEWL